MKELEYIRDEIRNCGYLSGLQIILRLAKRKSGITKNEVDLLLSTLSSCSDIHKIAYTNSYVSSLKFKDLYYYNPASKKILKRKRKTNTKKKTKIPKSA